jgi:hypothetical protein
VSANAQKTMTLRLASPRLLVLGWCDLVLDDLLSSASLASRSGSTPPGAFGQHGKLLFVGGQVGQPAVNVHVLHAVFERADLEGFAQFVVFFRPPSKTGWLAGLPLCRRAASCRRARRASKSSILLTVRSMVMAKDLYRTLQPLEKVHLHHADEELLAVLLAEVADVGFALVLALYWGST